MEIKIDQILFQLLNFGVVLGGLSFLLYKPILKVLDDRAKLVAEGEKAAAEAMQEKATIDSLKKKTMLEAEKQAAKIVEKAREDATSTKKEIIVQAKSEMKAEHTKALKTWESEKKMLISNMQRDFVNAVLNVAEKVLGRNVDAKKQQDLVKQGLEDLSKVM